MNLPKRLSKEDAVKAIQWGIAQGLITWPTPPPLDTEAKDFSPDLKRAIEEKKAEIWNRRLEVGP